MTSRVIGEGDHRGRRAHAFGIFDDLGILPSITATQELVVPRSIPITFAITDLFWQTVPGHDRHPAMQREA
jgi:hypothetical protein